MFDYQFTYDELSGLERTQFTSFSDVIEKGVKIDAHPAFVQLVIYYLTQFFGYVTWIIKLPFLLFSLGAITYAYFLGLRNFSKQAGLFSALIFSFSLVFIFYAPIARMYISGVFFSLGLLFYFFEVLFLENTKTANYFLFGLFAYLCALNQHINSLFAFTVCLSGFLFLKKRNFKTYLITCLLIIVAYMPNMPITLYQLGVGGIGIDQGGWLDKPSWDSVLGFLKVMLGTGKTYLLVLLLILICVITNRKIEIRKKQWFLVLIFLANYLIVYFYSIFRASIFQYSVMLFSGTGMVIFICSFLDFKNKYLFYGAFIFLFAALVCKSYFKKDYFNEAVKTVYEYQFERTIHYKNKYGDKNVYPIFFDADAIMKKIYFEKYRTNFDCKVSVDSVVSSMKVFSHFVSKLNCDYLVLTSSMPAYQSVAQQYFPYLLESTQTQAINYKLYSKRKEDSDKVVENDKVLGFSNLRNKGKFSYGKENDVQIQNNSFILKIDSLNEFPFDAKAIYKDVIINEGEMLLVKATLKLKCSLESQVETCISVNDLETNSSNGYAARAASEFAVNNDSTVVIFSDYFFGTSHNKVKDRSSINTYIWNRGKEKFDLINYEIKVIDYWPKKWHFWD